jgi:hypothetical protein
MKALAIGMCLKFPVLRTVFGITIMAFSLRVAIGSISYDGSDFVITTILSFTYITIFKGLQCHFDKIQHQSQNIEAAFQTLQAKHQDLNNRFRGLQTHHTEQVASNETSQARSLESLNNLQTAHNRLQMDYDAIRATSTADITTLRTAHDRLRTEYAALETMRAADARAFQTAHDNLRMEFDALQIANTTLTARRNRLAERRNFYRRQYRDIREQLDMLYINAPENAHFLLAERHAIIHDIRLTKDRRPDLRCSGFKDLGTNISWVLHDGKRVCVMIRTFSE